MDGQQDISGGELPNSPEWKYSILADYQIPMDSMPFDGFLTASWVWQDEVSFDLTQNTLLREDSYGVLDLSVGLNERASDRYRITLFVNNATDENYRSGLGDLRALYGGATALTNVFSRNSQRYYGVRAKFSF